MIPKSFEILGETINVKFDNAWLSSKGYMGIFHPDQNVIVLANRYKTDKGGWKKFPDDTIENTFYHELTHCVLYHMGHKLWDNEKFVDGLTGPIQQIIKTVKY